MKTLKELEKNLLENVNTLAKKLVKDLQKIGKSDEEIIKMVSRKFKNLSSIDILYLLEDITKISISGDLTLYNEDSAPLNKETYIFIPSKNGNNYYVEGLVSSKEIDSIIFENKNIYEEKWCDLCKSDEHNQEDCSNLKEMCKTHEKRIVEYCTDLRSIINPEFTNKQVLKFILKMNESKKLSSNNKYFYFNNEKFSIVEETKKLKSFLDNGEDKNVFGEAYGKVYKVNENKFPNNCSFIKLKKFRRG